MMTVTQFTPCPPLCASVCDLYRRSGYRHRRGSFRAFCPVFGAANLKQDKGPGSVSPRPAHFCPQCGQFREPGSGVGKTGMGTVKGTMDEKKPVFSGFPRVSYHRKTGARKRRKKL